MAKTWEQKLAWEIALKWTPPNIHVTMVAFDRHVDDVAAVICTESPVSRLVEALRQLLNIQFHHFHDSTDDCAICDVKRRAEALLAEFGGK